MQMHLTCRLQALVQKSSRALSIKAAAPSIVTNTPIADSRAQAAVGDAVVQILELRAPDVP